MKKGIKFMELQKVFNAFRHKRKNTETRELHKTFNTFLQERKTDFSAEEVEQYGYLISLKDAMRRCAEIAFSKGEGMDSEELRALTDIHNVITRAPDFDADRFWLYIAQAQLQKRNQQAADPETNPEHEHFIYQLLQSISPPMSPES